MLDVSKAAAVGANIRQARIAKGLTLDQLAKQSDLTRGYISLVERNLKIPSLAALLRMAAALGVNVANFFDPNAEPARAQGPDRRPKCRCSRCRRTAPRRRRSA